MEQVAKLLAEDIQQVVRSSATVEELDAWLAEPTYSVCGICGRQALQRWESLNGRCDSCRRRYLEAVGQDPDRESCAACHGLRWRDRRLRNGRVVAEKCTSCAPSPPERILETLRLAGVLPDYYRCTWATWDGGVPAQAQDFAADPKGANVLYVHGLQGRGKTHCATATFRELVEGGWGGYWRDCRELVDQCRRWIASGADDPLDEEILRLRTADLVLFDDLGSERQTEYGVDILDGLIRWRYSRQRPMIVTSNRSLAGLVTPREEGGLGRDPAVASRLRGLEIHLTGPDRRAREAK